MYPGPKTVLDREADGEELTREVAEITHTLEMK